MEYPLITYILIGITCFVSYCAFKQERLFDKYKFDVGDIVHGKEYYRFVTSGFLHVNWQHLIFNMVCLYSFASHIEILFKPGFLLIVYFVSMVAGGGLSLMFNRNRFEYSAVGASGAVSGVIFASIFLLPDSQITMFFIPFGIHAGLFAVLYVLFSIYGMKLKQDNIGHEAHLGGAIAGMLVLLFIKPAAVKGSEILFFGILAVVGGFLFVQYKRIKKLQPLTLSRKKEPLMFKPPSYGDNHFLRQEPDPGITIEVLRAEMDELLGKVSKKGIGGLSRKEKKRLEVISEKLKEYKKETAGR